MIHRRRSEDGRALGQRHDRVGVARAGQRVDVGDLIRVRTAAVSTQRFRHACNRVVGEVQRRCSDIAGDVRLAGHDRMRALRQRGRCEAPRTVLIRCRGAEDGCALLQRDHCVSIARAGQRVDVGDLVRVRAAAVGSQSLRHRWIDVVVSHGQRCAAAGIKSDKSVRALGK